MAATRMEERVLCAFGLMPSPLPRFESCQSVPYGGVMLLLPFLIECGLFSYQDHYAERQGYYPFNSMILTMSFFNLLRITAVEQGKLYNPGELGKLIGYDRIPEAKKLRGMIHELTDEKRCSDWGKALSMKWISEEESELYYIDGHVQVYHGYLAELGKKHVSRQKLCLPGMMEFWVNSSDGLPFFFITAPVNEKMLEMLENEIIPHLLEIHVVSERQQELMDNNPDYPIFTIVFDREGYSPAYFDKLCKEKRIAVLTYRKNVKDAWDENVFEEVSVEVRVGETTMDLHEEEIIIDGCSMREVRRLTDSGHQTSIITTNRVLSMALIACYMFGRWIQENFFRYLRQEYALDKIIQYAIDEIDSTHMVVNREYSNIESKIKSLREKVTRLNNRLYKLQEQDSHKKKQDKTVTVNTQKKQKSTKDKKKQKKQDAEEMTGKWFKKELELTEKKDLIEQEINRLIEKRKTLHYKIPVCEMPENARYTKLDQESKYFQNILKMICFRAETALANLLAPHYSRAEDEIRALVKAITHLSIDLIPDEEKKLLNIKLYPLANLRSQKALAKIIDDVNDTMTVFPGTNLVMKFQITTL